MARGWVIQYPMPRFRPLTAADMEECEARRQTAINGGYLTSVPWEILSTAVDRKTSYDHVVRPRLGRPSRKAFPTAPTIQTGLEVTVEEIVSPAPRPVLPSRHPLSSRAARFRRPA